MRASMDELSMRARRPYPSDSNHGTLQRDTITMRYFQATEITRPEADHIRLTADDPVSKIVVISLGTRWFDVRRLTEQELRGFVDQLVRGVLELVRARRDTPH
jgi:hypothetical protein